MHWQQLAAVITNVGDPRLKAARPPDTNWCYNCPMGTASADISEMEQAALHRISKSIAQLTLCQVTGEEIETATELFRESLPET